MRVRVKSILRCIHRIGCLCCITMTAGASHVEVFVSFSMPEQLMIETLTESTHLGLPVTLNGLIDDAMPKTMEKLFELSQKVPDLALQIDPTAFERYGVTQVPALVVDTGDCFDVIYGTLTLKEGLRRIQARGHCAQGGRA